MTTVAFDMDQALADFRELRELAALHFFDLFGLLREISDSGASVLCAEVDSFSAMPTGDSVVRYKLSDRLQVCLATLRAHHVHPKKVKGGSCDF